MRIGVLTGHWSTNVGNSFFQLGACLALSKALPGAEVFQVAELPGYQTLRLRQHPNALAMAVELELDVLVILGPFLRPGMESVSLRTLRRVSEQGTRLVGLGIGMMDYGEAATARYREVLGTLKFSALATRDTPTYEALKECGSPVLDAIDVAYFVGEVPVCPLRASRYVVFNFDKGPEPSLRPAGRGASHTVTIGSETLEFSLSRWRQRLSRLGRVGQFLESWFPESRSESVAGFRILRTDHRFNPIVVRNPFRRPATLWCDTPDSYLALYAAGEVTLSNRVHACVASLAFGNKAMLFSSSPRAGLLERAGAAQIQKHPVGLDMERLEEEKERILRFIQNNVT